MSMDTDSKVGVTADAGASAKSGLGAGVGIRHDYVVECRGPDGRIKWIDYGENIVPNAGLDEMLDKFYKGSSYTAAFYVGLTDGTPTVAAGDTMLSHAGWAEVTAYDEAARQTLTLGTVTSQSVDNSASKATFTVSTNSTTIGGAFLSTDATRGGTGGTLISVAAFTAGDKSLDDNDTLSVTVTATMASA